MEIEEKKKFLDKLFYQVGKQQYDFELCCLSKDKAKSKWRKYLDVQADDRFLEKANNRTILPIEIVIDVEDMERLNEASMKVKSLFSFYAIYKTGSRGFHVHLFFDREVPKEEKLKIIKMFEADGQKATERTMIALENCPHWKTNNPKELIEESEGFNNKNIISALLIRENQEKFKLLDSFKLTNILGLTIKQDDTNKLLTFLCHLSAYTEDSQLNISNNAPSSTGKSYIPMEIKELFPDNDVIIVGYCSPTAFFHDVGVWDKEKKFYRVDLSRKILIFLDQPHTLLLQHLRPLLSHDSKEIKLKITDKSQKHGLRTKNVVIKGYPAVIFCTAGLKIDEQEATRFILLSPETSQEKIREAISEKIKREVNKAAYKSYLENNPERKLLKERILTIRYELIEDVRINPEIEEKLKKEFFKRARILKPRHQRDIGRIISFIKVFALLNLWFREREGDILIANRLDLQEALKLWDNISESQELNLPPYIYNVYKEVILPCYNKVNRGLTRQEIVQGYWDKYGRPLQDWMLRQQILPMLINSGLACQESDPNDKRRALIYPTNQLTISSIQNNSEREGGGISKDLDFSELDEVFEDGEK